MIDKITPDFTIQRRKQELLSLVAEAKAQVESIPNFENEDSTHTDTPMRSAFTKSIKKLRHTLKTLCLTFDVLALELPTK